MTSICVSAGIAFSSAKFGLVSKPATNQHFRGTTIQGRGRPNTLYPLAHTSEQPPPTPPCRRPLGCASSVSICLFNASSHLDFSSSVPPSVMPTFNILSSSPCSPCLISSLRSFPSDGQSPPLPTRILLQSGLREAWHPLATQVRWGEWDSESGHLVSQPSGLRER